MSRRHPLLRMLVMIGAAVQLLSPGVASIADGLTARESASGPLTHVEATTSATCAVMHAPDCGMCRYLSGTGLLPRVAPSLVQFEPAALPRCAESWAQWSGATDLPDGRAPPTV